MRVPVLTAIAPSITDSATLSVPLREAAEKAAAFVQQSVPEGTQRAYAGDWRAFTEWCALTGSSPLPADPRVVAAFIADEADTLKPASIRRRLAAIAKAHKLAGLPNPCGSEPVPSTMKGIEARLGALPDAKAPATLDVMHRLAAACPLDSLEGLRNRALLLVGYAGAFRRSELVALEVRDLTWSEAGVVALVRKSKTDQRGEGKRKALPFTRDAFCAATALQIWLDVSGITEGPVFRGLDRTGTAVRRTALSAQVVALVVKGAAAKAGLDPTHFSGHSLRAGHVTQARAMGVADADTMSVTGHKKVETLNVYDRRSNVFQRTSAGSVLTGTKGTK
jgi:site-specific recombinase XerD